VVGPDGGSLQADTIINVFCGGTFADIECGAPAEAVAGSQSINIYTSLGMQHGLTLLAQYQRDPMSSFGKDVLQQLSQTSGAVQEFIIAGYAGSVLGAGGAVAVSSLTFTKVVAYTVTASLLIEFIEQSLEPAQVQNIHIPEEDEDEEPMQRTPVTGPPVP
jgi:hypothetical protein